MQPASLLLTLILLGSLSARATVHVVAAENFYGGVAREIGGDRVEVTSILSNPDQDPHLFTVDATTARAVEQADIIVASGIDYDPWMTDMAKAHPNPGRTLITVAHLIGATEGDNPHIWYKPDTMPCFAEKFAAELQKRDAAHSADYAKRLADFLAALKSVQERVAALKTKFPGTDVLATEPVFGYMAEALGFKMHDMDFQNHVMNNVEPSARETAEFETLLKNHQMKLLFYNSQASDPVADRMKDLARTSGVAVVGVTETEPAGTTFTSWVLGELDSIDKALAK